MMRANQYVAPVLLAVAVACAGRGPSGQVESLGGGANASPELGGTAEQGGTPEQGGVAEQGGAPAQGGAGTTITNPADLLSAERLHARDDLSATIAAASTLDAEGILAAHAVAHPPLGYDPATARYLDRIAASPLALNDAESAVLKDKGFVVSSRQAFCSFFEGLKSIYSADLPGYVSADAILESMHRSFDALLKNSEEGYLMGEAKSLLGSMRDALAASDPTLVPEARADADVYLAVGLELLTGVATTMVAGGSEAKKNELIAQAIAASGINGVELFGQDLTLDFSQFTPRGHYTDNDALRRYFRAMMWFGRTPVSILQSQSGGNLAFSRGAFDATLLLTEAMGPTGRERWQNMERVLAAFVGESDNLTPPELPRLLADLGVASLAEARALDDQTITATLLRGGYGAQRIASEMIVNGTGGTLPLSRVFLLFGQRYVVDSHVFANVVYDRAGGGRVMRMMPSPLDVAYAALGNDDALPLLRGDLTAYPYAPDLEAMRLLVDSHGDEYWQGSLYTRWLDSLRALSPGTALVTQGTESLPALAKTEAWSRRVLNSQLGSWAELRHNTVLYVKQSTTAWPTCEYPDAYVDPYPEFFARVARYAERGEQVGSVISQVMGAGVGLTVTAYFANLRGVAGMLSDMARAELTGAPFTSEQLAFVNDAVRSESHELVCVPGTYTVNTGWFVKLFLEPDRVTECKPTIADVHTQPADESGNPVGKVLHVGTGYPRLMVATVDTCTGPKAYVGVVFSYHERITEGFQRLTDEAWKASIDQTRPADVPFMLPVLAP